MSAFIVYATTPPTYAGYSTVEEAVAQARHDLTQPGHANPVRIIDVELPEDAHLLGTPDGERIREEIEITVDGGTETVASERPKTIEDVMSGGTVAVDAGQLEPCDCPICRWHLTPPEQRRHQDHPDYAGIRDA